MYSYTVLNEESEFTFTFPQKSTDNIFKMASLSVKRSIDTKRFQQVKQYRPTNATTNLVLSDSECEVEEENLIQFFCPFS